MGCIEFKYAYGAESKGKESICVIHWVFDLECNFFDTVEMYSYFKSNLSKRKAVSLWDTAVVYGMRFSRTILGELAEEYNSSTNQFHALQCFATIYSIILIFSQCRFAA